MIDRNGFLRIAVSRFRFGAWEFERGRECVVDPTNANTAITTVNYMYPTLWKNHHLLLSRLTGV